MIMLHDLRMALCVCSEGSSLFHITDCCLKQDTHVYVSTSTYDIINILLHCLYVFSYVINSVFTIFVWSFDIFPKPCQQK